MRTLCGPISPSDRNASVSCDSSRPRMEPIAASSSRIPAGLRGGVPVDDLLVRDFPPSGVRLQSS